MKRDYARKEDNIVKPAVNFKVLSICESLLTNNTLRDWFIFKTSIGHIT